MGVKNNNGFVHIYDNVNPKPIIRIDPPDSKTNYPHMHFYDGAQNSLDINGKIVDYRSSEAHVPWINDQ
jgi:S-layer y domain ribonuclease